MTMTNEKEQAQECKQEPGVFVPVVNRSGAKASGFFAKLKSRAHQKQDGVHAQGRPVPRLRPVRAGLTKR